MPLSRPPTSFAGKVFSTLFLTPFALIGLVSGVFSLRLFSQALLAGQAWGALLAALLVPLLFILVGVGGIYLTWRPSPPLKPVGTTWIPSPQGETEVDRPQDLRPSGTRLGRLLGTVVLATLWNGMIGVFVWHVMDSFRHGSPEWGLALFLSIFVLVGIGLLLAVPYNFLALWNPRPVLRLSSAHLRLGETAVLQWGFDGLPGRLRRLVLTLEGREEATVQRGKSSSTLKNVFHTVEIADTREPAGILQGTTPLPVPGTTMHSFVSGSCRVVWTLKVAGEIPFWPDLDESFEVAVLPRDPRAGGWA